MASSASTRRRSRETSRKRTSVKARQAKKSPKRRKLSRTKKPEDMTLDAWQRELRRQFGREQDFELKNIGDEPIFSEFRVVNPASGNSYRVAIRGTEPGDNYCCCPDFATNTLGTCKHIEFTLAKLERKRGAKKAFAEGFEPSYSEVYLQYGSRRRVKFQLGGECPPKLARLAGQYFGDEGRLKDDAFQRFDEFLHAAGEFDHELRCCEDALRFIAEVRDARRREETLDKTFKDGLDSKEFNGLLSTELYRYQKEGILFAARAGRSLIADEMGLGKTIQAIAAAEIMARWLGVQRVLIVCPTSLKHQWQREIERFTDRSALVIGGLLTRRRNQFAQESFYKITNYDTVHRDLEMIDGWSPDLVVLDEAQRIKNWQTRTAQTVKKIESPYCIVLTGTPLENRLEELVSIVQFVDQHRLGPTFRFLDKHQEREADTGRVIGYRNLGQINETLAPILLRRRKDEVLDQLPERVDKQFFLPMTEEQWDHHQENADVVAKIVHKWRRYGFLAEADQRRLMIALQYMRMSCNSTYLIDHETDFGYKADELATILDETFEQKNSKAVVFSQWTRTHELIERRLEGKPFGHVFFHGGVPSDKRKNLIDRFRDDDDCRVFLSTDAGGVGLNLQFANVVAVMDQPWNPAVLEQRIGRVHRLGQKQPVRVVHFIAEQTIEERMLSVLGFKKGLFAGVLDGGETEVFLGESRLNKFMKTVEEVTDDLPKERADAEFDGASAGGNAQSGVGRGETTSPGGEWTAREAAADDPLAAVFQAGLALLNQFADRAGKGSRSASGGKRTKSQGGDSPLRVTTNEATGRPQLNIELPEPDVIDRALAGVKEFLERLRG